MSPFRSDFPIFQNIPDLVYLDSASTAQKPQAVVDAMVHCMTHTYANVHRGMYDLSTQAEAIYTASKQAVCSVLHTTDTSEIIYTYNANYATNMLAQSMCKSGYIHAGDEIVVSAGEHHANIVPWVEIAGIYRATVVPIPLRTDYTIDIDTLAQVLTPRTRVVCISAASNVTGEIVDLAQVRRILDTIYTPDTMPWLVVDASQYIPHHDIDVVALGIDALVCTGHKMMSDTGLGILYCRKTHLQKMIPAWSGGGAIDSVSMTGYVPAGLPYRYEPGTPHIVGAASVLAALQYIQYVGGYSTIAAYEDTLVQYMCERIRTSSMYQSGDMVLVGSISPQARIGVFSFHFPRYHVADIADALAEDNICVRTGRHCTDPLHDSGHIPATLRVSLYMYSTTGDIDRFFARLEEIVNGE